MSPDGAPRAAFRVVAAALALVLTLAGVELALRLVWRPKRWTPTCQRDPLVHHQGIPNANLEMVTETGKVVAVSTNSLGLRDVEYGRKGQGVFRIIALGDSFTEAGHNHFDETSTKLLEARLNREFAGPGRRFEVVNAGHISFSPVLEWLYLTNFLIRLEPDLALLNLDMTDVQDDYLYSRLARRDERGEIVAVPWGPLPTLSGVAPPSSFAPPAWLDRLRLTRFIRQRLGAPSAADAAYVRPGDILGDRLGATRDGVDWTEHYRFTGGFLVRMDRFLRERGVPFVVFVYPHGHQTSPREWVKGRRAAGFEQNRVYTGGFFPFLEGYCPAQGLDCRLLLPDFRSYRGRAPLFLPDDGHFDVAGERLLADCEYRALTGGLLPAPASTAQ